MPKPKANHERLSKKEVTQRLRDELENYKGYLPPRYSSLIHERLGKEYSQALIRQTKIGTVSPHPILIELIAVAKENYYQVQKALKS